MVKSKSSSERTPPALELAQVVGSDDSRRHAGSPPATHYQPLFRTTALATTYPGEYTATIASPQLRHHQLQRRHHQLQRRHQQLQRRPARVQQSARAGTQSH